MWGSAMRCLPGFPIPSEGIEGRMYLGERPPLKNDAENHERDRRNLRDQIRENVVEHSSMIERRVATIEERARSSGG